MKFNTEEEVMKHFMASNLPRRKVPVASVLRLVSRPLGVEAERESLLRREQELIEAEKAIGGAGAGQMYLYHAMQERMHGQAKELARDLRRAG